MEEKEGGKGKEEEFSSDKSDDVNATWLLLLSQSTAFEATVKRLSVGFPTQNNRISFIAEASGERRDEIIHKIVQSGVYSNVSVCICVCERETEIFFVQVFLSLSFSSFSSSLQQKMFASWCMLTCMNSSVTILHTKGSMDRCGRSGSMST